MRSFWPAAGEKNGGSLRSLSHTPRGGGGVGRCTERHKVIFKKSLRLKPYAGTAAERWGTCLSDMVFVVPDVRLMLKTKTDQIGELRAQVASNVPIIAIIHRSNVRNIGGHDEGRTSGFSVLTLQLAGLSHTIYDAQSLCASAQRFRCAETLRICQMRTDSAHRAPRL